MTAVGALARACHPAPTVAVTAVATALGAVAGLPPATTAVLAVAVLAGQLTIGWSNDLVDADRDARVGRADKPLATGELRVGTARVALAVAVAVTVVASLALGVAAGLTHLLLMVGSGWAYNLGLKRTAASAVPYVVAFGSLPAVPWLALDPPAAPPAWALAAGALLGLGAHLLNVLPDLDDDAATGVRGLPHRLGRRASERTALGALVLASLAVVVGPGTVPLWAWAVLGLVVTIAVLGVRAGGRAPFRAALVVAVLDVAMLLARG